MPAMHLAAVFLAGDPDIELPQPDDPFLIAALIAVGLWFLLLGAFAYSTRSPRVEPSSPTPDLGPEPPAIVNFLVNGCRVTTNALQATLLDLAARRFLDVEEYDAGNHILCRIKRNEPDEPLEIYTQTVLNHVKTEAVDGVVVAQALTTGEKGRSQARWRAFQQQVVQDARARDLSEDRWSQPRWRIIRLAGLAAGGLVILVAARANALEPGILVVLLAAASVHGTLVKLFGDQRLRPEGYDEAAHWLGVRDYLEHSDAFEDATPGAVTLWDRYMAYAAAMGLANNATRALPMGAEDDGRAWSAYGGKWREVRVVYPRFRIVWGRSPLGAFFVGLCIAAFGAGLGWLSWQFLDLIDGSLPTEEAETWLRISGFVSLGIGLLICAWGLRTIWLAFLDFGTRHYVQGEIIRRRSFEAEKQVIYFMALDDGKASSVRAWRVRPQTYHAHPEGSVVKARISPRLGYVHEMFVAQA